MAAGDKITEAVRVSTIMDHVPDAVKSMLRLSPLEKQRHDVDALNLWVRESSYATLGLLQGSARCKSVLSKDGGKGKKGKNKVTGDKGKDKGKHESSHSSKSKERDSWNSGQQQVQFEGYCSHWSKWRHKRADCRKVAVAGIEERESKSVQWSDVDSHTMELDSSSWCLQP